MKKILLTIIISIAIINICYGQTNTNQSNNVKIKKTIIGFLKWYKLEENDTIKKTYSITIGGYPDTTKQRININGVEQYLDEFRKSQFVSETYINDFRTYFLTIDRQLAKMPKYNTMVKTPGLDIDLALQTFEPELILNNINKSRITKLYIIYNKALASLNIAKNIDLLFILTKTNNKWVIDYMGHDATNKNSFFRQ